MSSVISRGYHPDKGGIDIAVDKLGGAQTVQGPEHQMTHDGKHFTLAHYFSDIDSSAYGRIRFKTPDDKYLHATFFAARSAGILLTIYRDPDFTHNASNALTSLNRNDALRTIYTDPLQEACHAPSGSGSGDVFIPTFILGAGGNPTQSSGGVDRDANEVVLDLDTVYLIEAQSLADNNKVTIGCDFYYRESNS